MTSRGTPIIYYGDELAMPGGGEPDNRRDFPGGFPGDARSAFTPAGRTAVENEIWNYLAKLGKLRQELESLRRGKTLDLLDEEQQMAYARVTDKQAVIVVFNNDTKSVAVAFDVSMLKQLGTSTSLADVLGKSGNVKIVSGAVKFTMAARSSSVFVAK